MMLSVIIPTCNRNDFLSKCLECLHQDNQLIPAADYEVIVTDDSKGGIARELIKKKYPWAKWVAGPQKGPASNRNNGAKLALGEWLAFVDDDCMPTKEWLLAYKDAITKLNGKVYEGLTDADKPRTRFNEESPVNLVGGNLWSCNFAIRKDLYFELKGFDEQFPYPAMEDTDFHIRVKEVEKVIFVAGAKVIHPWRVVKPFKSYYKWIVSNKYFLKKHQTKIDFQFRYIRFKLFVGSTFRLSQELVKYSFRGIGFYFEKLWFHFLMIFI